MLALIGFNEDELAIMIPIIAIAAPFITAVVITGIAIFVHYRKRRDMLQFHHQERMAAIERGIELPPLPAGYFGEPPRPARSRSPHGNLLKGMVWSFVGLALLFALRQAGIYDYSLFALIPIGIGLAHLIFYFAVGRKEAESIQPPQASSSQKAPPVL